MSIKRRIVPVLLVALPLLGSCKCEKLQETVGSFIGFSKGENTDPLAKPERPRDYTVRKWQEDISTGRSRALADIEVSPEIDRAQLEKVLADACHDDELLSASAVVKVTAWPGKLDRLVKPLGVAVFARDGHGWEGTRVGFEELRPNLPSPKDLQSRGLEPVTEEEYLLVLGLENGIKRGQTLDQATSATAERLGVGASEVKAALDHAQQVWGRGEG
jgi:hypothetical protein